MLEYRLAAEKFLLCALEVGSDVSTTLVFILESLIISRIVVRFGGELTGIALCNVAGVVLLLAAEESICVASNVLLLFSVATKEMLLWDNVASGKVVLEFRVVTFAKFVLKFWSAESGAKENVDNCVFGDNVGPDSLVAATTLVLKFGGVVVLDACKGVMTTPKVRFLETL